MYRTALTLSLCTLLLTSFAAAQDTDRIKTTTQLMPAVVTGVNSISVTVSQRGQNKEIPAGEVEYIQYTGEPRDLTEGRNHIIRGAYEDAAETLAKLDPAKVPREEMKHDLEFYLALSKARSALAGKGDLSDAARQMKAFADSRKQSYHYFEAAELLGDLGLALGKYAAAAQYLNELAKAPWPGHQMRASIGLGRALLGQNKHAEALAEFDKALKLGTGAKGTEQAMLIATLGKADCLAATGNPAEGVKLAQDVIAKAPPEAQEVYARAYNTLGNCYRALKQPKEALLAFLHVPVLFSAYPESHAEALANLKVLWVEVNQAERGKQAEQLLKTRYPNSRWAAQ